MGSNQTKQIKEKSQNVLKLERKRTDSLDFNSLNKELDNKSIELLIEITPDVDYNERKKSVDWFVKELEKINTKVTVSYKVLHTKQEEFYVYVVRDLERKIIFSNSESHKDTVTGSLLNKKNYFLILMNIVEFLKTKPLL